MDAKTFVISTLVVVCAAGCQRKRAAPNATVYHCVTPAPGTAAVGPSAQVIPAPALPLPAPPVVIVQTVPAGSATSATTNAPTAAPSDLEARPQAAAPSNVVIVPAPTVTVTVPPSRANETPIPRYAYDAGPPDAEHFEQVGDDTSGSGVENP